MATTNYVTQSGLGYYDGKIKDYIQTQIGGITQFDYAIVSELPQEGTKGVFYFVPNSGTGTNVYDEYLWYVTGSPATGHFELVGTTEAVIPVYAGDDTYIEVIDNHDGTFTIQMISGKAALVDGALQKANLEGDGTYVSVADGTGASAGKTIVDLTSGKKTLIDGALQAANLAGDGTYTEVTDGSGADAGKKIVGMTSTKSAALDSAVQSGSGDTYIDVTKSGTALQLSVTQLMVSKLALADSAVQPEDIGTVSDSYIDSLFE